MRVYISAELFQDKLQSKINMIKRPFDSSVFELCDYLTFVQSCKECAAWNIKEACYQENSQATKFMEENNANSLDYRKFLYLTLSAKKINEHAGRLITVEEWDVYIPTDGIVVNPFYDSKLEAKNHEGRSWLTFFDVLQLLALQIKKTLKPVISKEYV
jgi:hypothetical protein